MTGVRPASESAFEAQRLPEPAHLEETRAALEAMRKAIGKIGYLVANPPSCCASPDDAEDQVKAAIALAQGALADLVTHAPKAARRGLWRTR